MNLPEMLSGATFSEIGRTKIICKLFLLKTVSQGKTRTTHTEAALSLNINLVQIYVTAAGKK